MFAIRGYRIQFKIRLQSRVRQRQFKLGQEVHFYKDLTWEGLGAGGEGDDRG